MRDLKKKIKNKKGQSNRRKRESQPIKWRKLLRRTLKVGVAVFSVGMILIGGFFMTQLLMNSDLFRVDKVTVKATNHFTEEQIIALSDIEIGVNTFNLDLGLIGNKIEENPWVQQADVQRIFPRQVVISLTERKPVAIINLGLLYYLDAQGEIFKVLGGSDDLDYPIITGFDYAKAQHHDGDYVRSLRQIVALMEDLRGRDQFDLAQVSEIHHTETGGITLYTLDGGVEVKLGKFEYLNKLNRLERIYPQLQPKLHMLDYIDLNVAEKVIVGIERHQKGMKS